jgi:uncharacterized protein (DUF302 family)
MNPSSPDGVVTLRSAHTAHETIDNLERILQEKGVRVFARIDQREEAEQVGLILRPTELLIFGNPEAGTPLMQAVPSLAIDLPLKIVAWDDEEGSTWVAYNSPEFLRIRHGLNEQQVAKLDVRALVELAIR